MGFSNYLDYHRYQYLNNVLAAGTVINRSSDVTQKHLLQCFSLVVIQIHLLYCRYLVPPVTGSTRCLWEKNKKLSLKKTPLLQIHQPGIIPQSTSLPDKTVGFQVLKKYRYTNTILRIRLFIPDPGSKNSNKREG